MMDVRVQILLWIELIGTAMLLIAVAFHTKGTQRTGQRESSAPDDRWLVIALMAAAFVVRGWIIPAFSRHLFDGHEADYFDVWRRAPEAELSYRASDLLLVLYQTLGPLCGGSGFCLLLFQLFLSLLGIWLIFRIAEELSGTWVAAVLAAVLLGLDPVITFWSSSAYNIEIPFLLSLGAFLAFEHGLKRRSWVRLALASLLLGLAVAARLDALLVVVPLGFRLWYHRRTFMRYWPYSGVFLALSPAWTWPFFMGSEVGQGGDPLSYLLEIFQAQWNLGVYFSPYHQPIVLIALLVSIGVLAASPEKRGVLFPILGTVAVYHGAYAFFNDYDYRHTLLPRAMLVLLVAIAASILLDGRRRARALGGGILLVVGIALCLGLRDLRRRYYAGMAEFRAAAPILEEGPLFDPEKAEHCVFIVEDTRFPAVKRASHFEIYTRSEEAELRKRGRGCILFVYDLENFSITSRSINGRAVKLTRLFHLRFLGRWSDESSGRAALVYQVGERR